MINQQVKDLVDDLLKNHPDKNKKTFQITLRTVLQKKLKEFKSVFPIMKYNQNT